MSSSPSSPVPSSAAPPTGKLPNETVRALVSLWLLFHLFGVTLALTTNPNALALPSSPIVDSPFNSKLLAAIKSAPLLSQYMYALWLDIPHDYLLTYGDYTDADHIIQLDLVFPDGHKQQWQIPPQDRTGEQRERYNILAKRLAVQFYSDAPDKSLLASIGQDLLQQSGASEVQVQIRRHTPLNIDDAAASDPGQHDPNNPRTFATIYTGSVTLNSLGKGEVHDLGQAARDVAPVTGPRPGGRTKTPMPPMEKAPSPPVSKPFSDILSTPENSDSTSPSK
jgi:hypothetical protein